MKRGEWKVLSATSALQCQSWDCERGIEPGEKHLVHKIKFDVRCMRCAQKMGLVVQFYACSAAADRKRQIEALLTYQDGRQIAREETGVIYKNQREAERALSEKNQSRRS